MSCRSMDDDPKPELSSSQLDFFNCGCCDSVTLDDADVLRDECVVEPHEIEVTDALAHHIKSFPFDQKIDMNVVHPSSPPFLGTSYWKATDSDEHEVDINPNINSRQPILIDNTMVSTETKATTKTVIETSQGFEHSPINTSRTTLPYKESQLHSPNFIIQNTHSEVSTPNRIQLPLETSSVSTLATATTFSSSESSAPKEQTARRLFGDRGDLSLERKHVSTEEDDYKELNLNSIDTTNCDSMSPNTTMVPLEFCGINCEESLSPHNGDLRSKDDKSIILQNGVLVKRSTLSPSTPAEMLSNLTAISANQGLGDTVDIPDGVVRHGIRHVNTLPSFRAANPICLRVTESYAGYSSGNLRGGSDVEEDGLNTSAISLLSDEEQKHFYSYDPYFSSGQYIIETQNGREYGNELRVTMGEQYMTLQDGDGRIWAVTRSRHSLCPSTVIYSAKERYAGQIPSSHRPLADTHDSTLERGVELYPWALVKKEGQRMDHDVAIHLVAEPSSIEGACGSRLIGGLFDSKVSYRSRHGFDGNKAHLYTIVYRIETDEGDRKRADQHDSSLQTNTVDKADVKEREIPCCTMLRDPRNRDIVDVTIAPGIDPLLIICYLAVHAKMDVEPKLCEQ